VPRQQIRGESDGRDDAADFDDEHHRVFDHEGGIQFLERATNRGRDELRVPE